MITNIKIVRFKNLEELALPLGRVTVLVGSNNAGKSSVLQALQFSTSMAQSLKLEGKSVWTKGAVAGTLSTEQLVYSPFRDIDGLAHGGSLRQTDRTAIKVSMTDDLLGTTTTTVRRGKNKNLALNISGKDLGHALEPLTTPFMVLTPGLAGIPAREEFRSAGIVRRAAAKGDANSVLRNILWLLKSDQTAWQTFRTRLREVFPALSIEINFDPESDETIEAHVRKGEMSLPLDSSGTGVLQVVQILAYIGVYKPRVLLLDEPDSHLHPANQRILGTLLANLTEELDFQVILSTHSRHLLDELRALDATVHWIDGGTVSADSIDHVDMLLGLGALDAGDRLRNGKTPWVLLTEDKDRQLVKNLIVSNGIPARSLDVWSYRGCTNLEAAAVIAEFIREHAPGTNVIVHRDRDYLSDEEVSKIKTTLRLGKIVPFITSGTDVESHYLNPEFLADHFSDTRLTIEVTEELINTATSQTRQESLTIFARKKYEDEEKERKIIGKSGKPDNYKITQYCDSEFARFPHKYRHGKKTIKALRNSLSTVYKVNDFHFKPSPHLIDDDLKAEIAEISASTAGRPQSPKASKST